MAADTRGATVATRLFSLGLGAYVLLEMKMTRTILAGIIRIADVPILTLIKGRRIKLWDEGMYSANKLVSVSTFGQEGSNLIFNGSLFACSGALISLATLGKVYSTVMFPGLAMAWYGVVYGGGRAFWDLKIGCILSLAVPLLLDTVKNPGEPIARRKQRLSFFVA
uniref:Uncharacterized protein n=1 Tax=Lotharella oceanica TaxID=641309 RepID=A0A7S2TW57_9EUKA